MLLLEMLLLEMLLLEMLNSYGDPATNAVVIAERTLLAELHGGCSVPVGAYAASSGDGLKLTAQVTSLDGRQRVADSATGTDSAVLGKQLARKMLAKGAEAILRQIRGDCLAALSSIPSWSHSSPWTSEASSGTAEVAGQAVTLWTCRELDTSDVFRELEVAGVEFTTLGREKY